MALRRVVRALNPSPARVAGAVAAGSAALGSAVALAAVSAWLISRAAQHPPVLDLSVAVVAVRALGISRGTFRYVERLASHDVALRGVVRLREELYERLAWADRSVVSGLRSGDLLSRVGADVDLVADVVVRGLLPFAVAAVVCLATVGFLAAVLPWAAVVVGAALLLAVGAAPRLAAVAAGRYEQAADATRAEVSAQVHALLDGATELTVAGRVDDRLGALVEVDTRRRGELDRAARPGSGAAALSSLLTGLAVVGALATAAAAVSSGRLDGVLLAVAALTPLALVEVVSPLPAAAVAVVRARGAAERLAELLDAPPAHSSAERPVPTGPHHLRAEGLAVGWPGQAPLLDGVTLDLQPGRVVAVVGASGAGKSTLLRTLAGLLPPAGGSVTLDGVALADLDPTALRRTVTLTAEDAHVFATTLRDNLLVARGDATDDELWQVLRLVHLDGWAAALDAGLATMLDPRSVSGGERRRLLLARALLVGSAVLLLDEPAEHLDPELADRLVRDLVGAARARGITMVVVTHRLEPLGCVDEVLTVESTAPALVPGTFALPEPPRTPVDRGGMTTATTYPTESPAPAPTYPVHVDADTEPRASRWLWLVKWLLAVPHYIVLAFLWVAFVLLSVVAFVAILFTGRYPRAIFDFNVGVLRWSWRVAYYSYGALATDRYPPFTLDDVPDYPARLQVDYPEHLSRGLALVKWWLLALPHYVVVGVFLGSGAWIAQEANGTERLVWGSGLVGILVLVAAVVLGVTGRYPRPVYDLLLGLNRWVLRVAAYASLMTDRYPPFRLDLGPHELLASGPPAPAPPAAAVTPPPAAAVNPPPPAHPGGWSGGRVVSVVVGSVLALASLGLLTGGFAGLVADRTMRDGDFLMTHVGDLRSDGYAAVVDDVLIEGSSAGGRFWPARLLGDVRVSVTSADATSPVFVGIAPAAQVTRYLAGVEQTVRSGPNGDLRDLAGTAPAVPPEQAGIWVAQVSGTGTQDLTWTPARGRWSMVVMNADGTAVVDTQVDVGATLPALPWVGASLMIAGLVLLVAGTLLVVVPVRAAAHPRE